MRSCKSLFEDLTIDPILGTAEMAEFLNTSALHIRRLARSGKIPAPIKIGTRKLGWRASTAAKIISDREAALEEASTARCRRAG